MKITPEFLQKYNVPGPRYTSYPPATSFHTEFTDADFKTAVIQSNAQYPENISIYIHIPFCPQHCYFCGCNTASFESPVSTKRYIDCVLKEIDTVAKQMDKLRLVSQIHWGGGTPNSINLDYVEQIINKIKSYFTLTEKCELAIECNPAYMDEAQIDRLAKIGFNRISIGVQDFHQEVLDAINRKAPKLPLEQVMQRIRENNFEGVNIDLVYGLPLQTLASFKENIEKVIALSPDRIVTFSYAHVPWVKPLQQKMDEGKMANADEKFSMLLLAYEMLTQNGYEAIGMDHFAKTSDSLAIAKHTKTLHRNFQGYCTRETTGQVYAFGTSSISQLWGSYTQNLKNIHHYMEAIEAKGTAVERGYQLTQDEIKLRELINAVMCNGYLNFNELASKLSSTTEELKALTKFNPAAFESFIADGLVELNGNILQVTADGMFVVRNIAMLLDPNLSTSSNQFSKTV